jgi:hypothetical protein
VRDPLQNADISEARGALAEPVRLIGNTVLDYFSNSGSGNAANPVLPAGYFDGLTVERDNVVWRPNGVSTDTSAGPMETVLTISPFTTRGPRLDTDGNKNFVTYDFVSAVDVRTPSDGVTVLRPASNATIAGAATGAMSRTDILGTVRPANASAGAVEVAQ